MHQIWDFSWIPGIWGGIHPAFATFVTRLGPPRFPDSWCIHESPLKIHIATVGLPQELHQFLGKNSISPHGIDRGSFGKSSTLNMGKNSVKKGYPTPGFHGENLLTRLGVVSSAEVEWNIPSSGCKTKIPLKQLRWGSGLCDSCYNKSSTFGHFQKTTGFAGFLKADMPKNHVVAHDFWPEFRACFFFFFGWFVSDDSRDDCDSYQTIHIHW